VTDPITPLSKLTPAAPNRDELLFAAGRATARPNRWWKLAVGALAVSQVATLTVWLWPRAEPVAVPAPVPVLPAPAVSPPVDADVEPSTPPDPQSYLAFMLREGEPVRSERAPVVPDRPARPLTAGSRQFD
jgi:hypothetical protein